MSIRALTYARKCLKHDPTLGTPARLVFMLLADSCNNVTGRAYTGGWLADQAGIDARNVRKALASLRRSGYLNFHDEDGKATVVTFPTAAYISTAPDENVRGEQTRAPDKIVLGGGTKSSSIPGTYTSDDYKFSNNLEVIAREALCCDGTGWVYDESTDTVTPCPLHHPRAKASS